MMLKFYYFGYLPITKMLRFNIMLIHFESTNSTQRHEQAAPQATSLNDKQDNTCPPTAGGPRHAAPVCTRGRKHHMPRHGAQYARNGLCSGFSHLITAHSKVPGSQVAIVGHGTQSLYLSLKPRLLDEEG